MLVDSLDEYFHVKRPTTFGKCQLTSIEVRCMYLHWDACVYACMYVCMYGVILGLFMRDAKYLDLYKNAYTHTHT